MPIVDACGHKIFFAHVPKAGGSSIEDYLLERFGNISLLDRQWSRRCAWLGTTMSSPQHITANEAENVIDWNEITYCFAFVRDPVSRVVSEFRFQQQIGIARLLLTMLGFSVWLRIVLSAARRDPTFFDNHLRPQTDIVPECAEVFHLEEGFSSFTDKLDEIFGKDSRDFSVGHRNISKNMRPIKISRQDIDLILRFYQGDFKKFDYSTEINVNTRDDRFICLKKIISHIIGVPVELFYKCGLL